MRSSGVHDVFEYDGAFWCKKCQVKWGALPGHPEMPENCERSPYQDRYEYLEREIKRLKKERETLRQLIEGRQ